MRTSTQRQEPASSDTPDATDQATATDGGSAPFADNSQDAKRLAAAVLEVLAGTQTPSDAAQELGISLARYYQLEVRALNGLVAACEIRRRGRWSRTGNELADLRKECEQLRRECARQHALVRATRRTGLADAAPAPAPPAQEKPKLRKKRRPVARAMKMAALLKKDGKTMPQTMAVAASATEAGEQGQTTDTVQDVCKNNA